MTKKAIALYFLLFSTSVICAQGYNNIFGKFTQFNTPRSLGLGGAGLASELGSGAVFMNPALMSLKNSRISVRIGYHLIGNQEERSIRVFDSFDNYLTDEIYAIQKYSNGNLNASLTYAIPFIQNYQPVIGIGFSQAWDFNVDYKEQLRNPDPFNQEKRDLLYGYNILQSNGAISQIPLQFSVMPFNNMFFAAGLTFFTGSIEQKKYVNALEGNNPPFADTTLFDNRYELDGQPMAVNLSFAHLLNKRLTYGLRFDLPYTLKFKKGYFYEIPARIGAGIDYRAKNLLMARFNLDIDYRAWSKTKMKWSWGEEGGLDGDPGWRDTWTFKVGIEHFFHEDFPFRLGFNYDLMPQEKNQSTYLVTAGSGFVRDQLIIDISGGMGSRSSIQSDLFPNTLNGAPDRQGDNALDKVKEIYFELLVAATYNF